MRNSQYEMNPTETDIKGPSPANEQGGMEPNAALMDGVNPSETGRRSSFILPL